MLSRSYKYLVLVIALNKIGAIIVPVDPDYPTKRIEHMINITKSENIIISDEYASLHNFNISSINVNDLNFDGDGDVCLMVMIYFQ